MIMQHYIFHEKEKNQMIVKSCTDCAVPQLNCTLNCTLKALIFFHRIQALGVHQNNLNYVIIL